MSQVYIPSGSSGSPNLVRGNLTVTGNASIDNNLTVNGNEIIDGNLTVLGTTTSGAVQYTSLGVSGDLTVMGNETVGGTLGVTGVTTLTATPVLSSNQIHGSTATVTLPTTAGTLALTSQIPSTSGFVSTTTLNNNTLPASLTSLSVSGGTTLASLGVTGNETVGGTLGVTGASTLSSLSVTGNETVGGTLGVTGASTLSSLSVTGNESVGGSLAVTGNETVGGNLTVTGTSNLNGASNLGGQTIVSYPGAGTTTRVFETLATGMVGTVGTPNYTSSIIGTSDTTLNAAASIFQSNGAGSNLNSITYALNGVTSGITINGQSKVTTKLNTLEDGSGGASFVSLGVSGLTTTSSLAVTNNETVGGTLAVTGVTTLTATPVLSSNQITGSTATATLPSSSGTLALVSQIPTGVVTTTTLNNSTLPAAFTTLSSTGATQLGSSIGVVQTKNNILDNGSGLMSVSTFTSSGNTGLGVVNGSNVTTSHNTLDAGNGNASVAGTLAVTGVTTLTATPILSSNQITGTGGTFTLPATGGTLMTTATLNSNTLPASFTTLAASGASTLASLGVTGNETVGGTLGVTGTLTASGDITASGIITSGGSLHANSGLVLGSASIANGGAIALTLPGSSGQFALVSQIPTSSSTPTYAAITITGNETVGGTLGVTGASTLSSLSVTGNETVGGTLGVTGTTTTSQLVVTNPTTGSSFSQVGILIPNTTAGNYVNLNIGQSATTNNIASLYFSYVGAGSSSNFVGLGFNNTSNSIRVSPSGGLTVQGNTITNNSGAVATLPSSTGTLALTSDIPGSGSSPTYAALTITGNETVGGTWSSTGNSRIGSNGTASTKNSTLDDGSGNMTINNTQTGALSAPFQMYQGSMPNGGATEILIGQSNNTNNTGYMRFNYTSNASSTNSVSLGCGSNLIQIAANGSSSTSGSFTAGSLLSSGTVTVGGNSVLTTGGSAAVTLPPTSGTIALTSQVPGIYLAYGSILTAGAPSTISLTSQAGGFTTSGGTTITFPTSAVTGTTLPHDYLIEWNFTGVLPFASQGYSECIVTGGSSASGSVPRNFQYNAAAATTSRPTSIGSIIVTSPTSLVFNTNNMTGTPSTGTFTIRGLL